MRLIDPQDPGLDATLRLENQDDVFAWADAVRGAAAIELQFPKWTDGRAYSQAVLLRARLRYAGEIVAIGEVLVDMLPLLRRCGFDAVRLRADQDVETARRALSFLPDHYQRDPAPGQRRAQPVA